MILVEYQGRLGNQMFEYAFAIAAARRLGTDFAMCDSTWYGIEDEQLSELFELNGRSGAVTQIDHAYPIVRIDPRSRDDPAEELAGLRDNTQYSGLFQSDRYFAEAAEEVRAAFQLRPVHQAAFRALYPDLLERPYVCCHVRKTDYAYVGGGICLPASYYRKSLRRLAPSPDTPIVFIGDDLDDARRAFSSLSGVRFEHNDKAVDLQLLMHADAVVVSNSTFAWWGAWLNTRPGKRVLAPKHWNGWNHRFGWHSEREGKRVKRSWTTPNDVIPDAWVQVTATRSLRDRLFPRALKSSLALAVNNAIAAVDGVLRTR
jgi:hypothetical protein